MDLTVWKWMVRSGHNPYSARKELGFEGRDHSCTGPVRDPDWCFQRFGVACVTLPDGRVVHIGGEHEDWYDPDFCIYNDVVVINREDITIYGYPEELFPPTDFHSATLVGDQIWLIGSLSYPELRHYGQTQVLRLDARTFQLARVESSGQVPGWINGHSAHLLPDGTTIEVASGKVYRKASEEFSVARNFETFHFNTTTQTWQQITDHSTWREVRIHLEWSRPPGPGTTDFDDPYSWFAFFSGAVFARLDYPVISPPRDLGTEESFEPKPTLLDVFGTPMEISVSCFEVGVVFQGPLDDNRVRQAIEKIECVLRKCRQKVKSIEYIARVG
jgi:hypothetical protein